MKEYPVDTQFEKVLATSLKYKIILKKIEATELKSETARKIIKQIETEIRNGTVELPESEEEIEKLFDVKKREFDKRMKQLELPEKSKSLNQIPKKRRGRRRKDED